MTKTTTERLQQLLAERHQRGLDKYGTTVDRVDLTPSDWCQHLLEELLDAAAYVHRLKETMVHLEDVCMDLSESNRQLTEQVLRVVVSPVPPPPPSRESP